MKTETYKLFVGIDWGHKVHAVEVIDGARTRLMSLEVTQDGKSIWELVDKLSSLGAEHGKVAVGVESHTGALVEALVGSDLDVYTLNPKQLDRFRDRHTLAGCKDDAFDAFVLADALRTDLSLYRRLEIESEDVLELRELSRAYDALKVHAGSLGNQVETLIRSYYLELFELGNLHNEPWLWELFEKAPTPDKLRKLSIKKLDSLLTRHHIRRYAGKELRARFKSATPLPRAKGVAQTKARHVSMLLKPLRALHQEKLDCKKQITEKLASMSSEGQDRPSDADIVCSFPGIGPIVGSKILSEASSALHKRDYHRLRAMSGIAPVSRRTGGRHKAPNVSMRRACNDKLREALFHWAKIAAQHEPRAKAHFIALKARGHRAARAYRTIADRLLKALIAALKSGTLYCPERRPIIQF